MGTVVENNGLRLHLKGAPEVILPLCYNISSSLYQTCSDFTRKGYRVLACAVKELN